MMKAKKYRMLLSSLTGNKKQIRKFGKRLVLYAFEHICKSIYIRTQRVLAVGV